MPHSRQESTYNVAVVSRTLPLSPKPNLLVGRARAKEKEAILGVREGEIGEKCWHAGLPPADTNDSREMELPDEIVSHILNGADSADRSLLDARHRFVAKQVSRQWHRCISAPSLKDTKRLVLCWRMPFPNVRPAAPESDTLGLLQGKGRSGTDSQAFSKLSDGWSATRAWIEGRLACVTLAIQHCRDLAQIDEGDDSAIIGVVTHAIRARWAPLLPKRESHTAAIAVIVLAVAPTGAAARAFGRMGHDLAVRPWRANWFTQTSRARDSALSRLAFLSDSHSPADGRAHERTATSTYHGDSEDDGTDNDNNNDDDSSNNSDGVDETDNEQGWREEMGACKTLTEQMPKAFDMLMRVVSRLGRADLAHRLLLCYNLSGCDKYGTWKWDAAVRDHADMADLLLQTSFRADSEYDSDAECADFNARLDPLLSGAVASGAVHTMRRFLLSPRAGARTGAHACVCWDEHSHTWLKHQRPRPADAVGLLKGLAEKARARGNRSTGAESAGWWYASDGKEKGANSWELAAGGYAPTGLFEELDRGGIAYGWVPVMAGALACGRTDTMHHVARRYHDSVSCLENTEMTLALVRYTLDRLGDNKWLSSAFDRNAFNAGLACLRQLVPSFAPTPDQIVDMLSLSESKPRKCDAVDISTTLCVLNAWPQGLAKHPKVLEWLNGCVRACTMGGKIRWECMDHFLCVSAHILGDRRQRDATIDDSHLADAGEGDTLWEALLIKGTNIWHLLADGLTLVRRTLTGKVELGEKPSSQRARTIMDLYRLARIVGLIGPPSVAAGHPTLSNAIAGPNLDGFAAAKAVEMHTDAVHLLEDDNMLAIIGDDGRRRVWRQWTRPHPLATSTSTSAMRSQTRMCSPGVRARVSAIAIALALDALAVAGLVAL